MSLGVKLAGNWDVKVQYFLIWACDATEPCESEQLNIRDILRRMPPQTKQQGSALSEFMSFKRKLYNYF